MASHHLRVDLGARAYDIALVNHESAGLGDFARQRCSGSMAVIVADRNVAWVADRVMAELARHGFHAHVELRPPGEEQKTLATASELYERLLDLGADRSTLIVALGGGVIGDLAGFVAATFARGLPLLMVPTTLLAMVDSSVGGKVGVNLPRAKNMVGAFHQPVGVWIDLHFLDTLPEREFRSGLAEAVKYGVILDANFFDYIESHVSEILNRDPAAIRHVVARCCELKRDIVAADERDESGRRAILNYGHTFAHAFETAAGYGAWLHGEAVAAGMMCASRLAERLGLVARDLSVRQMKLLQAFALPIAPDFWPVDGLLATMRTDKKSLSGRLRLILPTKLGAGSLFGDVPEADVRAVLEQMTQGATWN